MKTHNYEHLGQTFVKYVSSNVLGMIGLSCYILADTFFVANGLGAKGLAALNIALPIFSLIYGIGLMIGMGSATKYTILSAVNQKEKANHYFTQALFTSLFFSILFVLAGNLCTEEISILLGSDQSTLDYTTMYLRTVMSFAPMFCMNHFMLCFVRNDGNPKLAMYATLAGSFTNIIFDYIFIFPMNLGMLGAALATGMSPVVGLLIMSRHVVKGYNQFHLRRIKFDWNVFGDTIKLGFSSFINEISAGVVIFAFNVIILKLSGNIGVAAYGVVANIALVVTSLFTGIGQGIQPLISYYHGKNDKHNVKKTYYYALFTALCLGVLSYVLIYVFREPLVAAFNKENSRQLAKIAKAGIVLYFIGFIPSGFNVVSSFYMTSSEQASKGLVISVLRGLVFIVMFVVGLSKLFGMTGVWLAFPSAEILTAVAAGCFLYKQTGG